MSRIEVQDVLRSSPLGLYALSSNSWQARTLYALSRCRTAEMGGHIDQCRDGCGAIHISYNSCRNRHCPKCQGHMREKWIKAREADLLNTSYFHVVFTLPSELNDLCLWSPKELYDTLFSVSWSIIRDFGTNPDFLGASTAMIGVLHTWGQNLSLHPHLHCLIPAGGITPSGKWKRSKSKGKWLFDVKSMKKVYRARVIDSLRKQGLFDESLGKNLLSKDRVIYAKQPFYGPKQIIEYLGRYTHRVAISNSRIVSNDDGKVTFRMKDYRQGGKPQLMRLPTEEFISRFSLHILPKGYTRIRHYGILSSSHKKGVKATVDDQLGEVTIARPTRTLHRVCPKCNKGHLVTIATFDQRGPPASYLLRS